MTEASESILTKEQIRKLGPKRIKHGYIIAEVRFDDQCGNGHNSFAITAEVYDRDSPIPGEISIAPNGKRYWLGSCGCCHEEVQEAFPELAHLLKWHLSSTDGPMHYIANAVYWAGHSGWRDGEAGSPPNLEHLKSTICYGVLETDMEFDLVDHVYSDARGWTWNEQKAKDLKAWLESRSGALLAAFCKDVQEFGFIW